MFKMRCLVCGSTHTKKNGVRTGVQLYKCQECGYQFRIKVDVSKDELWDAYLLEKQTISELSCRFGMSVATIKRRLRDIKREWVQPPLSGEVFVHLGVTYWGRGFGVLLALDNQTGKPLYMAFVKSETVKDYEDAVSSIMERGYNIRGLIIDGKHSLFKTFSEYYIHFYECYEDDAQVADNILGITVSERFRTGLRMAGFPHHALDTYLPKLIRAGQRVAICDQLEDPRLTKKLVKRGITELVTPQATPQVTPLGL